jgi:hypothetical protein
MVSDPEYLKAETAAMRRKGGGFDTLGLCLLALTMVCWEVVLSKGQEWGMASPRPVRRWMRVALSPPEDRAAPVQQAYALNPPSMVRLAPVTNPASGPAR